MNKKEYAVTLALMLVMSFLGGALAVTLLDNGQVNAASAGKYAGFSGPDSAAWAINTETGVVRAFQLNRVETTKAFDKYVVMSTQAVSGW